MLQVCIPSGKFLISFIIFFISSRVSSGLSLGAISSKSPKVTSFFISSIISSILFSSSIVGFSLSYSYISSGLTFLSKLTFPGSLFSTLGLFIISSSISLSLSRTLSIFI